MIQQSKTCPEVGLTFLNQPRSWSEAPQDILSLILSKLSFKDRRNFKLVCTWWNSIIPNAPLLPPPLDSPYFDSPCLIFPKSSSNRWKLFHSVYNDYNYLEFPELKDAEIKFSKDGWLLLMSSRHNNNNNNNISSVLLFFFNPVTKERFELPPTSDSFYSVCFTSPPTSRDCFVFGIFTMSGNYTVNLGHIQMGDEEWKLETMGNVTWFQFSNCPPLFYNGVYYCLDFSLRNFRVFDPTKDGSNRWMPYGKCRPIIEDDDDDEEEEEEEDYDDTRESYIAEVGGDIWGVFVEKYERRVRVEKCDFMELCWKKLESLGDKCLYVSTSGSFSETCSIRGMTNKIYFNRFRCESGVLYSLATGMYHSIEGGFASRDAYGLTHMEYGTWFKPTLDRM